MGRRGPPLDRGQAEAEGIHLRSHSSLLLEPRRGLTWRAVSMAPLHTLHRASQRLRVLTGDRAGRRTAVIAPLTLVAIFPNVPLFTALGCGDRERGGDPGSAR